MSQTIPKVYVTRFFQLVTMRQFAEAERIIDRLKQKIKMNERNRGYFQALQGMLLTQRSNNDRYAFLSNLNFQDKKALQNYRREFQNQSEYRLHSDYDRGYFSAWSDYMRIISKLEIAPTQSVPNKNNAQKTTEIDESNQETEEDAETTADEETATTEKESADEAEKEAIGEKEAPATVEEIERRQSTLVDFSKQL